MKPWNFPHQVGPCTIVAHSQGAGFAAAVARQLPSEVRHVVAVEPGGMPTNGSKTMLPPHRVIWGDHIEAPSVTGLVTDAKQIQTMNPSRIAGMSPPSIYRQRAFLATPTFS